MREPLARAMRRPKAWARVALLNLSAMTVFLWHQTAMMAVTALGLLVSADLPGLHTMPDSVGWIAARALWLPVFAAALALCWAAFRVHEQASRRPRPSRASRSVTVPRPRTAPAKEITRV